MLRSGSSAAAIELPLHIETATRRERPRRPSPLDGRVVRADPVFVGASMRNAIEAFGSVPNLRYLAVVDASGAPVGALPEPLVRDFLFSPFGHALLANPGYSHGLRHLVRDCPTAGAAMRRSMRPDRGRAFHFLISGIQRISCATGISVRDSH